MIIAHQLNSFKKLDIISLITTKTSGKYSTER
jgi:hypothetical protein